MNFNISFSSFQETGQTGTKHILNLMRSPDDTALNNQDDQVTLCPLKFRSYSIRCVTKALLGLDLSSTENPLIWLVIQIFLDSSNVDNDTLLKIKRRALASLD